MEATDTLRMGGGSHKIGSDILLFDSVVNCFQLLSQDMYFGIENEKETCYFRGIDLIFQFSRNAPDNACENITFRKLSLRVVIKHVL